MKNKPLEFVANSNSGWACRITITPVDALPNGHSLAFSTRYDHARFPEEWINRHQLCISEKNIEELHALLGEYINDNL